MTKREARVSLNEIKNSVHIDLSKLVERARTSSRRELVSLIENRQEELIEELCGPRYSCGHLYRRGGGYTKRASLVHKYFS